MAQVYLLATAESEKLRPLTEVIPGPMLPVANQPVMVRMLEQLGQQGFMTFVAGLYHLPEHIEGYIGDGRRWGVEIDYVLQREAWGAAGALKWAEHQLTDTFAVVPADIVFDLDLRQALAQHERMGSEVTAVLGPHFAKDDYGVVSNALYLTEQGLVADRPDEDGRRQELAATGVYIFEPHILSLIPRRTPFDLYRDLLPALLEAGIAVHGCVSGGYWNPLLSFAQYQQAQHDLLLAARTGQERDAALPILPRPPRLGGTEFGEGIWVERNHMIHPTARFSPPVLIGENVQVGQDAELGPDVVIGDDVMIVDGATIRESTVLDHTYVGELVNLEQRIVYRHLVVDSQSGEATEVVDEFLLTEAHAAAVVSGLRRGLSAAMALLLLWLIAPLLWLVLLATFLTTGHIFQRLPRRVTRPRAPAGAGQGREQSISLLRFYTRRANGEFAGVGRWLERYELHRLPELWNVMKGDIALVGVKPLLPAQAKKVTEHWQESRQHEPSGFTGLWYVRDGAGHGLDELLVTDAYYAATRSWSGDLRILLQTPAAWRRHVQADSTANAAQKGVS